MTGIRAVALFATIAVLVVVAIVASAYVSRGAFERTCNAHGGEYSVSTVAGRSIQSCDYSK